MSLIILIIILSVLIFVHEMGHFLAARKFGVRVDEFGIGYPPRALKLFKWQGTDFTLNWIPFGGFVKIFGEDPEDEEAFSQKDSFASKPRGVQAIILFSGVAFNFLFAWLIISLGFMTGAPSPVRAGLETTREAVVITTVIPGTPAELAGLVTGDTIVSLLSGERELVPSNDIEAIEELRNFIASTYEPIIFNIERSDEPLQVIVPEEENISGRRLVGISMDIIGELRLPPHKALWHGFGTTLEVTVSIAKGFGTFVYEAIRGKADLSTVAGPVGIVGMIGDVKSLGFGFLLLFTALLSINLSIINLFPFPALDGGRLLFVAIESIIRRPLPTRFSNAANVLGFAFLIFIMILVTIQDIRNVF